MAMRYQQLGRSDLTVSVITLGTYDAGAVARGQLTAEEFERGIQVGVTELGINSIETADVYGLGAGEILLSRAIRGLREQVVITAGVGILQDDQGNLSADLSAANVVQSLDRTLDRLGTDYVDVYIARIPDPNVTLAELGETFEGLRSAGKVRWWGVADFDAASAVELTANPGFTACMGPFNLLEREAIADALPLCRANGLGFYALRPLAMGLLSGEYRSRPTFHLSSGRSGYRFFQEEGFANAQHGIATLRRLAWAKGITLAQAAIAWTLHTGVTTTVANFRDEGHIRENAQAPDIVLSDHESHLLNEAFSLR
ncbi:MAG: aldo/keto reductase [Dehalococcoidia bacterium]